METHRKTVKAAAMKLAVILGRRIGDHKIVDDRDVLVGLAGDESHCEPVTPDLAVRVASRDDVVATLEEALRLGVPVTPRGGGTGKVGGAIPVCGGLVLDTTRLDQMLEIDPGNLTAVVEPGMINAHFQDEVEREGLFYPPDPNSLENCCLGGNVAHNAGGPRAFKYGVTREYVLGLELALMGGGVIQTGGRTIKTVAGYDLTRLLVGSEGTLGVFSKLVLRLVRKPPHIATLLVRFADEIAAGKAVSRIIEKGIVPRVMEFMDEVLVETLRMSGAGSVPADTKSLILAELDGASEELVDHDVERFADAVEAEGAVDVLMARHVGERNRLWEARRGLSDAVKKRSSFKVAEDVVVPRSRAADLLSGLRELAEKHQVVCASYGHAGDGNYHVNLLWDDEQWDPEPAVEDIFRLTLDLDGSITGEHGVGLAKKKYLGWEKSPRQLSLQSNIKQLFDPKGLMNPGKIFT